MKKYSEKYDNAIYPREAVIKAAYAFIKTYYVHLETENDYTVVSFSAKEDIDISDAIGKEFENELLAQTVRFHVYNETHAIREILMARAMSSSMIYKKDPIQLFDDSEDNYDKLDSILEDWFKREEE